MDIILNLLSLSNFVLSGLLQLATFPAIYLVID